MHLSTTPADFERAADRGEVLLAENGNPGRVLNMGMSEDGRFFYQGYMLGGRSDPSRNRVMRQEDNLLRTVAPGMTDEEMLEAGGSLRYYPALQAKDGLYVVSNGAQTSYVLDAMLEGATLREAVLDAPVVTGIIDGKEERIDLSSYEPDKLHTPRITGVIDTREDAVTPFGLAVVRKGEGKLTAVRSFYSSELADLKPGQGWGIQTYEVNDPDAEEGDPRGEVFPFSVRPYGVDYRGEPAEVAARLRQLMGERTFAAAALQVINVETGQPEEPIIVNRLAA